MAAGIPLFRIREKCRVLMRIAQVVRDERTIRDDLVTDMQVLSGDVAAESRAEELQADTVAETCIEDSEVGFPGFDRDVGELVEERERDVGVVFCCDLLDFCEDEGLPFGGVSKVAEDPGGVHAGVELGCEEGAHYELECLVSMRDGIEGMVPTAMILSI